jgi:hypothetical protein
VWDVIGFKLLAGVAALAGGVYVIWFVYSSGQKSILTEQYRTQIQDSKRIERVLDEYNREHLPKLYNYIQTSNEAIQKEYQKYLEDASSLCGYASSDGVYDGLSSEDSYSDSDSSGYTNPRQVQTQKRIPE